MFSSWYNAGGITSASQELKSIVQVFEDAKSGAELPAKFLNSEFYLCRPISSKDFGSVTGDISIKANLMK